MESGIRPSFEDLLAVLEKCRRGKGMAWKAGTRKLGSVMALVVLLEIAFSSRALPDLLGASILEWGPQPIEHLGRTGTWTS